MNNQNAIAFAFDERAVRLLPTNTGSFKVVAKDVADALEYQWNGTKTVNHVPEEWKGVESVSTPRGEQQMLTLTEEGLYFFLARSDKPKARNFQKWLAGEVLPSIRKNGYYGKGPSISQQLSAHGVLMRLADKLEAERHPEKRSLLHQQITHACRILGIEPPALDAIGHAEVPPSVPSLVDTFWEAVELIGLENLNHSKARGLIAINMLHFARMADEAKLRLPPVQEFRRVLRRSESPRFIETKPVSSRLFNISVKCWLFEDPSC